MKKYLKISICLLFNFLICQTTYTEYLIEYGDTLDVFSFQVPENYDGSESVPMLIIFHQWGGSQDTPFFRGFDEEANIRGWLFLSPFGGSDNNYNHQEAQCFWTQEILWMLENYNVDDRRLYLIGGSMGGAGGSIYANNHLDPTLPMAAATASGSGILDCERRYYEMDGNNSMIEWFGGTPEEVPFIYHRNSSVFFADSTQSMHFNLQHVPLYLDFGETEPHRFHAEDLYALLTGYNQNMWIDTDPDGGHGFSVLDEYHVCNWLSQFELIDDPNDVNVNLDEPGRAYWLQANNQIIPDEFIRIRANRRISTNYEIQQFSNSDSLQFILNDVLGLQFNFDNYADGSFTFGLTISNPHLLEMIEVNGQIFDDWLISENTIWLDPFEPGRYSVTFSDQLPDVNDDGFWDVLDIVLTLNFIMGNAVPNDYQQQAADINDDGRIDILDIVIMVNMIVGN